MAAPSVKMVFTINARNDVRVFDPTLYPHPWPKTPRERSVMIELNHAMSDADKEYLKTFLEGNYDVLVFDKAAGTPYTVNEPQVPQYLYLAPMIRIPRSFVLPLQLATSAGMVVAVSYGVVVYGDPAREFVRDMKTLVWLLSNGYQWIKWYENMKRKVFFWRR